jgi:hypothetical protein
MPARPIHTRGKLQMIDSVWHIILEESHASFEEEMTAEIVLWDSRNEGKRSEVEEIARIQQLDPSIVALALASEGALAKSSFSNRLSKKLTI